MKKFLLPVSVINLYTDQFLFTFYQELYQWRNHRLPLQNVISISNFRYVKIFIITICNTIVNYRIYLVNVRSNKVTFFNNNTKIFIVFMRIGFNMFWFLFNISWFITYISKPQSSFIHLLGGFLSIRSNNWKKN